MKKKLILFISRLLFVNTSYANTQSCFQTLVCIFDFFIPVVKLQYVITQKDGALGLYPFSEGPYLLLQLPFKLFIFVKFLSWTCN